MHGNKFHFHASVTNGFVDLHPTARGVEIELTTFSSSGEQTMTAVISREKFQQLIFQGPELLDGVDLIRDEAMRKRGYPI
ncbi:hypothetical protein SAMN02982929_05265 [Saccharopolyspora kobensis]|uniref:Uncharacterized protein n=1 Tax=Saccharopolyspora kobensis TaxID=146035 RepID=A0A1H6E0X9_9PSEU|nr:hypothetical protein [Saccharopolyspora kobensis]SEG90595.1 hypothetical protein SAMN02982929_05265 [Saccharopolyspora kobensis]SFD92376.1 hypothetical protein SAMN05216506_107241 [Saccharopolyspora kobensis]